MERAIDEFVKRARTILTGKMEDGVLVLPKDPGMFVARGIA